MEIILSWLSVSIIIVILILLLTSWYFLQDAAPPTGLKSLPGPIGLPLIGYLPFLGRFPYTTFTELGKKYGPLFQLRVGRRTVVVLNSREVILEAMVRDKSFAGRPNLPVLKAFAESGPSRFVGRTADKRWKFLRKNAIKALGLFASSKNSKLQAVVQKASESMNQDFLATAEQPLEPHSTVFECAATVIGSINFGGQFERNDPVLKKLIDLADTVARALQVGNLVDFLPFGSYIFPNKIPQFLKKIEPLAQLTGNLIENHQCNEQVTDIADALYKVSAELTDEELQQLGLSRTAVRYVSQDLFAAGFATVTESFCWCLNIMAVEQPCQRKLQEELDRVLQGREPTLNDRNQLPYAEATLLEVFRFSSLIPLLLPHATMQDTQLDGYYIPKDVIVLANIWGLHRDETVFEKPWSFQPERFLCSGGTELDSDMAQMILPFGCGTRRCVGENLARQELFLLLTSVIQKFQINPAPGESVDISLGKPGFNRRAYTYKLVFSRR